MRMSCNGCRVLRKGCNEDCTLRPCLEWLKNSNSQANATLFLAKFYGRAGLFNLINGAPHHLRPAIFRSLLHEACGRIINPIYGSVGLMWSGNWQHCQSAVDSVLRGLPITPLPSDDHSAAANPIMPHNGSDIRHLSKEPEDLHRVRTRPRFKRSGARGKAKVDAADESVHGELNRDPSHDSFSVETVEASLAVPERAAKSETRTEDSEIGLELTLGFNPVLRRPPV